MFYTRLFTNTDLRELNAQNIRVDVAANPGAAEGRRSHQHTSRSSRPRDETHGSTR